MTRHVDVMIDDTTLFDVMMRHVDVMIDATSNRVSCRRSLHQRVVSSHQPEWFVVAHYINVSCHHIKQSGMSSFITSKYRVIISNRVSCRRSLHQISCHHIKQSVVSSQNYIKVSFHHIKQSLDTLM
jgi:hypothetical protein